jgi:hypothetical protein
MISVSTEDKEDKGIDESKIATPPNYTELSYMPLILNKFFIWK